MIQKRKNVSNKKIEAKFLFKTLMEERSQIFKQKLL